jgi:hypothetical protein
VTTVLAAVSRLFASALIMWVIHTLFGISSSTTFECSKGPTHIDYLKGTQETDLELLRAKSSDNGACCRQSDSSLSIIAS